MDVVDRSTASEDTVTPDPDCRSTKRFRPVSESSHTSDECSSQPVPDDVPPSAVSSDASCQSLDVSPPSIPPSGAPLEDVLKSVSPNALVFREGDHYDVIDLDHLTRRCVVEESATLKCTVYLDPFIKDVLPVMSSRDARKMTKKAAILTPFAISSSSNHRAGAFTARRFSADSRTVKFGENGLNFQLNLKLL